MGVYLVAVMAQSQSEPRFTCEWPSRPGLVRWLFEYLRGPVQTVKLYFSSVNKFLYITMRTNCAKFAYVDVQLDESVRFFRLEGISDSQEEILVSQVLTRAFLLQHCFSASLMMNSAAPVNNPNLLVLFTNILFPGFRQQGESEATHLEYCPSLLLKVMCSLLPSGHVLHSLDRHSITPTDLLRLSEEFFGASEVRSELVYVREKINPGLDLIY